ncbi:hypothetical protein KP509_01G109800 [Ceratopteris richardii]|uniref:ABC transporter domain-containing protein n=1 Tax=Ceratopteris richardii TaxID=49495 RepID=A0A8T2VSX0_CERRI|nr:hypothetical protein KP509_01G109800 [Ceratopteris richardii]
MEISIVLTFFSFVQIAIVSVITMTVFFRTQLHPNNAVDGQLYMGALFFGLINVMFNGLAELNLTVIRLPVFYKEREQLFYPAWASSITTFITRIPLSMLESTIWVVLTYYVIGFSPEATRFFRQFVLLFLISQMAYSLFRFIGAAGRTLVIASTFGTFALMVIFLLGGFVLSRDKIPKWWVWGYWISPMMYGQNALSVNEFLAPRWNIVRTVESHLLISSHLVLSQYSMFTENYWLWLGAAALVGFTIVYNVFFTMALAYLNRLDKVHASISEKALQERHANQTGSTPDISISRSKRRSSRISVEEGMQIPTFTADDTFGSSTHFSEIAEDEHSGVCKRGMVLPFRPLLISFQNINYFIDMPAEMREQGERLQLLKDVSGALKPGILTGLVGVSGAGKTTLLDVLAGRKTRGYIEGNINISGFPKKQDTFARIAGYCEQTDIHTPHVTVWESLMFSAWLRLPQDVDNNTKEMFVDEVMELVELDTIRDAIVGLPTKNGLTTGQRKRLTIAVELVANPSIIFMDEPTTGLDARAAAIVMRTVRNTVDTGRTVVCTIHQPSIDIFEAFDELILMKLGGRLTYSGALGECSKKLVDYFESIPGVPKIEEGRNPAAWVLEVTSPASESRLGVDCADMYRSSTLFEHNQAMIKQMSEPASGSEDLSFPTRYSQSFSGQFMACLWKRNLSYWRNPDYNAMRLFLAAVIAILIGSIFWNLGSKMQVEQDIFNIMGAMYTATLFLGICNAYGVQDVVDVERTVYYREKAAGMYSPLSFACAQILIEVPYAFLQTIIYGTITFFMMNFPSSAAKFFCGSVLNYRGVGVLQCVESVRRLSHTKDENPCMVEVVLLGESHLLDFVRVNRLSTW